jgi:hypothetical protein
MRAPVVVFSYIQQSSMMFVNMVVPEDNSPYMGTSGASSREESGMLNWFKVSHLPSILQTKEIQGTSGASSWEESGICPCADLLGGPWRQFSIHGHIRGLFPRRKWHVKLIQSEPSSFYLTDERDSSPCADLLGGPWRQFSIHGHVHQGPLPEKKVVYVDSKWAIFLLSYRRKRFKSMLTYFPLIGQKAIKTFEFHPAT